MRAAAATWEASYAHDRRKSRHRCRVCSRVLTDGESVVMTRVSAGKTYAIHIECAALPAGTSKYNWRDLLTAWGNAYLRSVGHKVAQHPIELEPR